MLSVNPHIFSFVLKKEENPQRLTTDDRKRVLLGIDFYNYFDHCFSGFVPARVVLVQKLRESICIYIHI
jgi:isochorismate hydrolase